MRGLIVDYVGVLDGSEESQRRWQQLLGALKAAGIGIAILSNDPGGPGAAPIRAFKDRGLVDAVVLSGEIGVEKPEAGAFEFAAEAIELPMKDCVMVDDSILNVRAAVDNGLVGVYYQQFDRAVVEITGLFGIQGEF
ncbi:HAD-IA family hydrolase [Corynebacterium pseudopelargi]|uniref:Phosphoglycolate phosphatase n=1 Tax=Corynebacterium pseudopelargi TaxID=2080757 RepID=A0A3G6IVX6_9CORY|nr:HAD-IA family hydrolase [Corynebacterium pseudopelargi]AZA09816.1 Phosphoglycolate phosphatase [Corynebacterium pseudopelargi]